MIKTKKKKKLRRVPVVTDAPFSNVGEQLRIIRTKLLQHQLQTGAKSFLITSPSKGEGKSFITANLALTFAELNKKVLIIEANLRNPSVHHYFGKSLKTEQELKQIQLNQLTIHATDKANIYVIDQEKLTYNPSTFFSNVDLRFAIDIFKQHFDLILVDAPHALEIPELITLLTSVDSVIGVVNFRKTMKNELENMINVIKNVSENSIFVVVNK